MESLAVRYRPTSFDDLVGQHAVHVVLRQMVTVGKIPTALLFHGSRGTGKTTTARILAAALNCEHGPDPCGHCVSCKSITAGTSVDLLEIDAASNGLVDDMRALRANVCYGVAGTWRVVVLDEAHSMQRAAFNALLKILEEPPPATVFVFVTTEPWRIPDTIASRCMAFPFERIGVGDITARLATICQREQITAEPALLALIADRADGALRDAIMALDQAARVGITTAAGYADLLGVTDIGPPLLTAIAAGDPAAAYTLVDAQLTRAGDPAAVSTALVGTLRDLLVLHVGGQLPHQGAALTDRQRLAAALPTTAVTAAMKLLWDLKTRVRPGEHRTALDLAIALLIDTLAPAAPQPAAAARTLSLHEMRSLR